MKKRFLVMLMVFNVFLAYSQDTLSTIKKEASSEEQSKVLDSDIKKELAKISSDLSELKTIMKELKDVSDTVETTVGVFTFFKKTKVPVYRNLEDSDKKDSLKGIRVGNKDFVSGDSIEIIKILFEIKEGRIFDVQVFTSDNRVFTNFRTGIEINRFMERCDKLTFFDGFNNTFIRSNSFLSYERNNHFLSEDIAFELNSKDSVKVLKKTNSINETFNFRVYSDLLGVFGDESNGLNQFELNVKAPVLSNNFYNRNVYVFKYMTLDFGLSKFDSEFNESQLDSTFTRLSFYQKSWLNSQVGINLISGLFRSKSYSSWSLDLVSGFGVSNYTDTSSVKYKSALPYWGLVPSIKILSNARLTIGASLPFIWQTAPQLNSKSLGQTESIVMPELEIAWDSSKNTSSKVFGRVNYVKMRGDYNPFWKVQLGYNVSITDLINNYLDK